MKCEFSEFNYGYSVLPEIEEMVNKNLLSTSELLHFINNRGISHESVEFVLIGGK